MLKDIAVREIILAVDVIIEPDEPGFHAYAPAFKGLHMGGDTREEALANARDAIIAYIESYVKHGEPIPVGPSKELKTARLAQGATHHVERVTLVLP
ncbi:MAG: type II toxin-antitoxin system HicB family antitoxin [Chloroflexi bacterium]|nr:type II toxin-antitoxin system HicB family antitoxin [Chloroflexota bacterium]